jgi:hypothetical protein
MSGRPIQLWLAGLPALKSSSQDTEICNEFRNVEGCVVVVHVDGVKLCL